MGTSMLVLTGARLVGNLCSWQCANIPCFKPPPSWQTRVVSSIVSLPLSIVLHILTRFERRRTCLCCYMCAPFLPFSSHKFLHLFTFAHPFFSCFVLFVLSFFHNTFPLSHLYAHFCHRPQHFFSARLDATARNRCDYPPVSFSFHSSQSSRNLRLLTTHIPPYSPRVVVIVLILSTLGWCPLNLIIGKISVFLSTDSQSTGFLTLNSHAPVFALLSPFIAVAVIKWNSSLQVSATWSVHFVGNESCNVHIKNYSIIWLGMGQTLAQGPPNPRWRQTNPQTPQSR